MQELSYTLILITKHLKTAWQHTKTSAGVELHVDSHLPTFETAWQHTKTSAAVELHVDSHLTTLETAWQHTKTSAGVELHFDSHLQHLKQPGSTPKQVQKLSYTLILIYKKLKTAWQHTKTSAVELHVDSHLPTLETALAAHQNKCKSWATRWFSFTNS